MKSAAPSGAFPADYGAGTTNLPGVYAAAIVGVDGDGLESGASEIAAINLVRGDALPELSHRLYEPLEDGELLLNIRAEVDPDTLEEAATAALESEIAIARGLLFRIAHLEHFRPGMPVPTHRMTAETT